jgi:hypothetical protein
MIGLVIASWLAMQVQGAGRCPSPGEVEEKLAPLLPVGFASSPTDLSSEHGSLETQVCRDAPISGKERRLVARPASKSLAAACQWSALDLERVLFG